MLTFKEWLLFLEDQEIQPMFSPEHARKALEKSGYNKDLPILGKGENGYAFKDDDRVIKVTSELSEYKVGMNLMGMDTENIVKIYKVQEVFIPIPEVPQYWIDMWQGEAEGWDKFETLYVIESEYVTPLKEDWVKKVDLLLKDLDGKSNIITKQLKNMIKELERAGGKTYDVRGENMGIKDDQLKLYDIGAR